MANKTKVTPQNEEVPEKVEGPETPPDSQLLDLSDAAVKTLIRSAKKRDSEFAAVDAQPRNVHGFRRCGICDLNDLLKVFVGLRLARARVSLKKVLVLSEPSID